MIVGAGVPRRTQVVIPQNAPARSLEIAELAGAHAPEEGRQPQQSETECQGEQDHQDIHDATPVFCRGRPRPARSALSVTTSDEPDIATAATSGVAKPATAIGTATALYSTANQRFSSMRLRALRAMRRLSATGIKLSPMKTMSAEACARSVALIGEIETWALARAGASLSPSPIISTLRPLALSRSSALSFSSGRRPASAS